jgi:hypothetical protein
MRGTYRFTDLAAAFPAALTLMAVLVWHVPDADAAKKKEPEKFECDWVKYNLFRSLYACAWEVDGRSISGFRPPPREQLMALDGPHRISIHASFRFRFMDPEYRVSREVTGKLVAGRSYVTTGVVTDTDVKVWLEDAKTGERVSTIGVIRQGKCWPFCLPWKLFE